MDALLGIVTILLLLISLLYASIKDVRTGEVPDRVWFLGIIAFPIGLFRLFMSGLVLLFTLQSILTFTFVLFCFGIGLFGGADGKAILVTALVYPWLEIDQITLVYAPILTLTGTFLILGVHCFVITILNVIRRHQYSPQQKSVFKPKRRRHWFTRRISEDPAETEKAVWRKVTVPLVLYILITYLALLLFQILL